MVELTVRRFIFLTALALVGLSAFWSVHTVFGFLPFLVALFLYLDGLPFRVGVSLLLLCFLGTTAIVLNYGGERGGAAAALAELLAAALCTVLVVKGKSSGFLSAAQVGPSHSARRNLLPRDPGEGVFAQPDFIREDDQKDAMFASARAFWTEVTQVTNFRLRQEDGTYRLTKIRTAPPVPGVEVSQLVGKGLQSVVEQSGSEASNIDPITAAKTIENLFGNGWAFDAQGRWIYLPPFTQATLGHTPSELNKSCDEGYSAWRLLLHPDEYETVTENWQRSLTTGALFIAEFRIRRKTGYAWARSSARALRDEHGKIAGWYGTSIDLDVDRKTVDALHEREKELLELVNVVPSNLWRLSKNGEPDFFNSRMVDYLGIPVEKIAKPGLSRLDAMIETAIHPEDRSNFKVAITRSLETGEGFSSRYRLRRFDGAYHWMSSRAEALRGRNGEILQWCGLCHDIDDQVRIEEALVRSEWHLQQLIDALPVRVCSWTPEGEISYVSKRYLEELGLTTATFAEMSAAAMELVHPEDAPGVKASAAEAIQNGTVFLTRYRRRGRDGIYRWTDGRFEPLRNGDGKITEWYGLAIDVDDEMRVQKTLRESEQSLQQLVETLPAMIYCATPDGKPIYRSQKLREYLGFGLEDKDGLGSTRLDGTLEAIIHPDDLPLVRERYGHSLATGKPYVLKHRLRRYDGQYRWMETRTSAMRDKLGTIIQWNGVCLDIDDWVRAQEELGQAQRNLARASEAASLAELTASIAHEVGQPLAALVSSSDACQQWLSADPPNIERAQRALERVTRSAGTATEVVNRIRALFKHNNDARRKESFDSVLAEARELMGEEALRRNVHMEIDSEGELPFVLIDRVQIQQVLVNLVRNAFDALEPVPANRTLKVLASRKSNSIEVQVIDNGLGIQNPDRIFEPFFTTKGQGMGMGLAICRSIVESHGGQLWVDKTEPRGATFTFTLPIDDL
ncbi:PAS domain-containing sensor histidine kinase [Neorhizobium sp. T25_27]|uniref:PAS domain-containing sensor histidine kinase n=1 Tax=Neorhizobium sp. T25_27 TaxID=2093831 RepID=UPI000CF938F6|nr:PAS domain-containing sensor histidine kinase [Neorhizobium sp. T25_27]